MGADIVPWSVTSALRPASPAAADCGAIGNDLLQKSRTFHIPLMLGQRPFATGEQHRD